MLLINLIDILTDFMKAFFCASFPEESTEEFSFISADSSEMGLQSMRCKNILCNNQLQFRCTVKQIGSRARLMHLSVIIILQGVNCLDGALTVASGVWLEIPSLISTFLPQSLLVSILAGTGLLAGSEDQKNLSNFLICMEMLPAAIGMLFAFPYLEYKGEPSFYLLSRAVGSVLLFDLLKCFAILNFKQVQGLFLNLHPIRYIQRLFTIDL